jgi:hypothetical protein
MLLNLAGTAIEYRQKLRENPDSFEACQNEFEEICENLLESVSSLKALGGSGFITQDMVAKTLEFPLGQPITIAEQDASYFQDIVEDQEDDGSSFLVQEEFFAAKEQIDAISNEMEEAKIEDEVDEDEDLDLNQEDSNDLLEYINSETWGMKFIVDEMRENPETLAEINKDFPQVAALLSKFNKASEIVPETKDLPQIAGQSETKIDSPEKASADAESSE